MLLPHEPLIKIVHSKIKCYNHKTQKKIKTGEFHTYTSKQFLVPLKNDQPFSCDDEVAILKSDDYFKMDKVLKQRKLEYDEYLQRNIILERELIELKEQLKNYHSQRVETKSSRLEKLEKELKELSEYKNKYLKTADELQKTNKELLEAQKKIKDQNILINEFNNGKFLGKLTNIFSGKKQINKKE